MPENHELEEKIKQVTKDLRAGKIKPVKDICTVIKSGKIGVCSA